MNTRRKQRIKQSIIRTAQLQLFLSLIALPILIAWGLPFSLLSAVSTVLFGPLLSIFLLLSSLIFFLEILHVPNTLLIFLLEKVTDVWLWLLSWEQKFWLIGFKKPPIIFLCSIVFATLFIIQCKYISRTAHATLLLLLLLIGTCIGLKCLQKPHTVVQVNRETGNVTVIAHNNQTIVIDPGVIGRNRSAQSWTSYTLIPEIVKKTGSVTIDHLIVLQLNIFTFQAIEALCKKMTVKNLYLPWWTGHLPYYVWRHFAQLRETTKNAHTNMVHISNKPITINNNKNNIILTPLEQQLRYNDVTYPVLCVSGQIDNEIFTIYAAKHKTRKGNMHE